MHRPFSYSENSAKFTNIWIRLPKHKWPTSWHKETKTKVHFATLMDICHLINAELEPKSQKNKGRFVLRGDNVKTFWSLCSFYWNGLVCVPDDCCKNNGCYCRITRLRRTSSWCSIRVHSGKTGRRSQIAQNSKVRMSRRMDTSSTTQNCLNHGQTLKIQWYFSNGICTLLTSCGKDNLKMSYWKFDGKKYRIGNVCSFIENKGSFCQ